MTNTGDLYVDLASERLGGKVLAANDDFFAEKENLVRDAEPVWDPDRFTDRGKWMDGWETRRRREPGHDWAVVAQGLRGIVRKVVVDTSHFTGNYPEACSLEVIDLPGGPDLVEIVRDPGRWEEIVPRTALTGDSTNDIRVRRPTISTHSRFVIYPDGGVARLRLLGDPVPPAKIFEGAAFDLAALAHGGRAVDCSNRHYSSPNRMLQPGSAQGMWDGWETRRRRGAGHDWAIIRLAGRSTVDHIELDTTHFKGNAPGSIAVQGIDASGGRAPRHGDRRWHTVVPESPAEPHAEHTLEPVDDRPVTHLRLDIHPDGGVARLRVFGIAEVPWTSIT